MSIGAVGDMLQLETKSIPDHNAWGINFDTIEEQDIRVRFPRSPSLLSMVDSLNQPVKPGDNGFALNGVTFTSPYNPQTCCDNTFDMAENSDLCNGDSTAGVYGYRFFGHDTTNGKFDSCSMSCDESKVSGIVGVARDGFAIYGPMQYYSKAQNKIYIDLGACADCELIQINGEQTDACGGVEVADGDSSEGGQYRYIATGAFPYYLQCYRGDVANASEYVSSVNNWIPFDLSNYGTCDVNDLGYDEECTSLTQTYAEDNLCAPGHCTIRGNALSNVYFTCSADVDIPTYEVCNESGTTTSTESIDQKT